MVKIMKQKFQYWISFIIQVGLKNCIIRTEVINIG